MAEFAARLRLRLGFGLRLGARTRVEFARFCAIGMVGLGINLTVFAFAVRLGLAPLPAAVCSFCLAVGNNYLLNRRWTFRGCRGSFSRQGIRFFAVSLAGLGLNVLFLGALLAAALSRLPAEALAVSLVTPFSFGLNKVWAFRTNASTAAPSLPPLDARATVCVCVPTYNEADNVVRFVRSVLTQLDLHELNGTVLIIDDGSPDGTGALADALAATDSRVHVLHRKKKAGLGRAYQSGFAWALERDFSLIVEMDCDFSHDPASLPALIEGARRADLVLGSRYVSGGAVEDWPLARRLISRVGCLYARAVLGVPVRDLTGGFKCFRREVLEQVAYEEAEAKGYGFQIELSFRVFRAGFRVLEVPIVFRDRAVGQSKMSGAIAREAALLVLRLRFSRSARARLARGTFYGPVRLLQWIALVGGAGAVAVALRTVIPFPPAADDALALLYLAFSVVGGTTLLWMVDGWRHDAAATEARFPENIGSPSHSFSLIVPARHEEDVLGATLEQLQRQDHPAFEVLVVVGHDDPRTRAVAEEAIAGDERFRILVDTNETKNKPKALNTALPECRGEIVSVFDAEDIVAPRLLSAVDQLFQSGEVEVVQGATQLMNFQSSWFAVRNVLEYYFWFKSRLHFHARTGFIPLGGNTVFVRSDWLRAIGGWDEACLAEDCDLGARLSARGARTVVAYTPELVTREETPGTLLQLLKQRTRWNQGFLQVLRKDEWRRLPLRPRLLAVYTLAFPFLQATIGLLLPVAIGSIALLSLPIELSLLSFLPLVFVFGILSTEIVGLHYLGREFGLRPRLRDYGRLVVGLLPYQLLLSCAAIRAAWREIRHRGDWEKTAHVGAHL